MPFAGITSQGLKNAYPGLSSQDDPNNPMNQLRMLTSTGPAQQTPETQAQAMAGNSQNANPPQNDVPLDNTPAAAPSDPQSDYVKMMLSQMALDPRLQAMSEANIGEQQKGLKELQDYQSGLRGMPVQTDLSPLLALSDSLTGSKLAGSYAKPQTGEDRIGALAKLQNMTQDQRNKITQDITKLAQGKSASGVLRNMSQNQNLDFRQRATAQKQYDSQIGPVKMALEASSRFNDLLQAAKSGKLVPTSQLLNTLTEEQTKLATGKANYGEGSAEGLRINSYARDLKNLEQRVRNIPEGVLTPETAAQLEGENRILSQGYMDQADRTAKTLSSGTKPQQEEISKRHGNFKGGFQDQFGYWGGKKQGGNSQSQQQNGGLGTPQSAGTMSFDQWKASKK